MKILEWNGFEWKLLLWRIFRPKQFGLYDNDREMSWEQPTIGSMLWNMLDFAGQAPKLDAEWNQCYKP